MKYTLPHVVLSKELIELAREKKQYNEKEIVELNKPEKLWDILIDHFSDCWECGSSEYPIGDRKVWGNGNRHAKIMLIGEAPGATEELQLKPFVGRAGNELQEGLDTVGLSRYDDLYLTNSIICRPRPAGVDMTPGSFYNRAPIQPELDQCGFRLLSEIGLVEPEFIICMGLTAFRNLTHNRSSLAKLLRQINEVEYSTADGTRKTAKIIVTWHPSCVNRKPYCDDPVQQKGIRNEIGWALKYSKKNISK